MPRPPDGRGRCASSRVDSHAEWTWLGRRSARDADGRERPVMSGSRPGRPPV